MGHAELAHGIGNIWPTFGQDRSGSNIAREVKNLTANISEVKTQQADMLKSESNLQSTLMSKFSSLNDSISETTSTQKRNMKDLEAKINFKIDDQVGYGGKEPRGESCITNEENNQFGKFHRIHHRGKI